MLKNCLRFLFMWEKAENGRNMILKNKKRWIAMVMCLTLSAALLGGCGSKSAKKEKKAEKIDYDKCVTLGDYQKITLETSEIDSQVQVQIDELLQTKATYDKVTKGKVADGDTVNIHYVGKVDGKEFEGGSYTAEEYPDGYDLTIGSNQFIDGFEEALIGKKIGGTYDIDVTFPEVYSANADLAGKPAVFTVTINSKQGKEHLPELTDAFVKENVTGYDTVDAYKASLRETAIQEQAWSQVYQASKINEYPEQKLETVQNRMKQSITYYLTQQGTSMEDYLEAQNMTQEDFDSQMEESAKQTTGEMLVWEAIAEKQNLTVSDEEYQEDLKTVMTNNNLEDEKAADELFQSYYGSNAKDILTEDLLDNKVKEYLAGNVTEN